MTTVRSNSQLLRLTRKNLGGALNRLVDLLSARRVRRRTGGGLQARSDSVSEHIRRTRAKIEFELAHLTWL